MTPSKKPSDTLVERIVDGMARRDLDLDDSRAKSDLRAAVTAKLTAINVPPEKVEQKIEDATRWWKVCGSALIVATGFAGAGLYVLLQREPGIILAIALAVPVGLSVLVALYAASQADGEATKAFIATVLKLRRALAGKNGGS